MNGSSKDNSSLLASETRQVPVCRDDLAFSLLDGEALVYDARSGAVHCFSPTTLHVWQACAGRHTVNDVVADLAKRFEVDPSQARDLFLHAIEELNRRRLFEEDDLGTFGFSAANLGERETKSAKQAPRGPKPAARDPEPLSQRSISRRDLLTGGATKLALAAPVISTFFATGAYASGLSLSGSYGTDGGGACKIVGYSCAVNTDCCEEGTGKTACQAQGAPTNTCCYLNGQGPCTDDTDCCGVLTCSIGVCG